MKNRMVALFCLGALGLVLFVVPVWGAPQYLGETTWTISITMTEHGTVSESAPLTGAIIHMGGAYYMMQGYVDPPDDGPVVLAGGGVLIGNVLYFSLTCTQQHTAGDWRDTEIIQVQLNKTTLNGNFYGVGHDFELGSVGASPVFDSRYSSGTLTLSGAPIILSSTVPTVGPAVSLLLSE